MCYFPIDELKSAGKFLIVDDNRLIQKILNEILSKLDITDVTFVSSGKEAVERYKQDQFDFIFMDLLMPELDGFEASTQIFNYAKEHNLHPHIVAITGHESEENQKKCFDVGIKNIILKPINISQVIEAIASYLVSIEPIEG